MKLLMRMIVDTIGYRDGKESIVYNMCTVGKRLNDGSEHVEDGADNV
jgi:hypothetical protein